MKNNSGKADVATAIIIVVFAMFAGLIIAAMLLNLTPNSLTKNLGGTTTIDLEPGEKLEEITWKDNSLWYLTRSMRDDEEAETHHFKQSSSLGIIEGEVIIIEHEEGDTNEEKQN